MKKVLLGLPNLGWIQDSLFTGFFQWAVDWLVDGNGLEIFATKEKCNEHNYQKIAKKFWEKDFDFLIQCDDDNPPDKNPFDLIQYDKDIIGLPTPIWVYRSTENKDKMPFQWNCYMYNPEKDVYMPARIPPERGLARVDGIGAGCTVIARRVFEAPLMRKEGWHRKWDKKDGLANRGLDLAFCERARKCGFEIWCHWDYRCHHFKEVDLLDVAVGFHDWVQILLDANGGILTKECFVDTTEHALA